MSHVFEVEPRTKNKNGRMILASQTKSNQKGRIQSAGDKAAQYARDLLVFNSRLTSCAIYHTYPSPGPRRRFVGEVWRPQ